MAEYWCRFIDSRGRVYASEKLIARNDGDAVSKARAIALSDSFELWEGARLVDIERAHLNERAC